MHARWVGSVIHIAKESVCPRESVKNRYKKGSSDHSDLSSHLQPDGQPASRECPGTGQRDPTAYEIQIG